MTDGDDATLVVLVELRVRPEQRAAFLAYAAGNLPICRDYPGNLGFDVLLDEDQPDLVRFHERWRSAADQQAYMAWRTARGDFETLASHLAAAPVFRTLRELPARVATTAPS